MVSQEDLHKYSKNPKLDGLNQIHKKIKNKLKSRLDEFDAIRLKDYERIKQQKAAKIMDISQLTFHNTLGF